MADDKKLDEIIKYRKEKDKQRKMRDLIEETQRQELAKERIKRVRPPMLEGMPRGLSDIQKGLLAGARVFGDMPRPRPRSRELTPEEATRMERLRDEFYGRTQRGTTQLKKGGKVKKGYHKMPDGKIMKDSAHKMSCGGKVHKMKSGGSVKKCACDGIAVRGKTKARR